MPKILIDIPYLEGSDINPDASLKSYVNSGKPVLLLVYGSFCPHCTRAQPDFQKASESLTGKVVCATIQSDGGPTDQQASKAIDSINKSPGVPAYLGFNSQGKFKGMHTGGRDVGALVEFANSL